MQIQRHTHRVLSFFASLTLLASAGLAAQEPTLTAETFGHASGDVPMRGLGLVLELVQTDPAHPRLRLFGGAAGHPATILLSNGRRATPVSGPRNTQFLIGPDVRTIQGVFDMRGNFETSLDGLAQMPADAIIYAQGVDTGVYDFGDGPLVQASHAIELRRRAQDDQGLTLDEFLPHLPADRKLGQVADLAELLQTALDSTGDSLRLHVEIEASVGLPLEVADAKVGGKIGAEFTVTRTREGFYETTLAAEFAKLVGVSAGDGAEAGIDAESGSGGTLVYRFDSAPGAARGMIGMVLSLAFPAATPGADWMDSAASAKFRRRMAELRDDMAHMREHADELERSLHGFLDARVAAAQTAFDRAQNDLCAAQRALASASWRQRPMQFVRVGIARALVAAATGGLNIARAARNDAEAAVREVRNLIAEKRSELMRIAEGFARAGRIVSAVAELRPYNAAHYVGEEFAHTTTIGAELKLGPPVVDIPGLESSLKGEVQRSGHIFIERKTDTQPLRVTVVGTFERKQEAVLAVVGSVEAQRVRTIELSQTFERRASGWTPAGASLSFGVDTRALAGVGVAFQEQKGIGRTWSMSLSDSSGISHDWLASASSFDALFARIGSMNVDLELQDRREKHANFGFSVDVSGNGGGIEIDAEWADQGRLLSRTATVAQCVDRVMNGPTQVAIPEQDTVAIVP
jgi:hypothetical protein